MDMVLSGDVPQAGESVVLGRMPAKWKSKWFDFGQPQRDKKMFYLDVSRRPTSGTLKARFRRDLEDTVVFEKDLDMSEAFGTIFLSGLNSARFVQVELAVPEGVVNQDFEVTDLVWRWIDSDQK